MARPIRTREAAQAELDTALRQADNAVKAVREVTARCQFDHRTTWDAFRSYVQKQLEPWYNGAAKDIAYALIRPNTDRAATTTDLYESGFPPFVPASEVGEVDPPGFLVDSLILEAETGFIAGDGGVFKTTAALAIAGAVAGGYRAFERFETRRCPVAIVSEEDGADVIRNRLEALARGHGWDAERVLPNIHILARQGVTLEDEGWQAHIRDTLERTGARLLLLDPYRDLTNARENSNDAHRPNVRFLRSLNRDGVTALIGHHAGKAYEGQRALDRSLRGASALNAAARFIHLLERIELGVSIRCLKMSRAAPFDPFVVEPIIETEVGKPTVWKSARLRYVGRQEAKEQKADRLLVETLTRYGAVNSSGLKDHAKGSGVSAVEMSEAIKRNHAIGKINFKPGPHSSKLWGLATLPSEAGQPRQSTLPTLPEGCRARSEESARGCLPSIKEGRQRAAAPAGQPEADMTPEPDTLATEFDHELFSRSEAL